MAPAVPYFPRVCFDSSAHDVFTSAATFFLPTSAKEKIPSQYARGVCCGRTWQTAFCVTLSQAFTKGMVSLSGSLFTAYDRPLTHTLCC